MKEFVAIIIIFLIYIMAIVFIRHLNHRERMKREKIRKRAKKEREEIRENTKKMISIIKEETKQFECLIELFNNWIILYNINPKKFCTYEKEFFEWYEKITAAQCEYIKSTISNKNSDISFQNLLTMLKQFAKWTEGK